MEVVIPIVALKLQVKGDLTNWLLGLDIVQKRQLGAADQIVIVLVDWMKNLLLETTVGCQKQLELRRWGAAAVYSPFQSGAQ